MMTYEMFLQRNAFAFEELLAFSRGSLITDPPAGLDARLPAPPFLMMDRIVRIESTGNTGKVIAEQDIRLDAWYFQCHFTNDPVQPGCLGVDAVWQLLGFFCICSLRNRRPALFAAEGFRGVRRYRRRPGLCGR